jgi:hypothetical protein
MVTARLDRGHPGIRSAVLWIVVYDCLPLGFLRRLTLWRSLGSRAHPLHWQCRACQSQVGMWGCSSDHGRWHFLLPSVASDIHQLVTGDRVCRWWSVAPVDKLGDVTLRYILLLSICLVVFEIWLSRGDDLVVSEYRRWAQQHEAKVWHLKSGTFQGLVPNFLRVERVQISTWNPNIESWDREFKGISTLEIWHWVSISDCGDIRSE